LFHRSKKKLFLMSDESVALIATFLLAVSPWHISFSRGGFEVTVGLFFYLLAAFLALLFMRKKAVLYLLGSFFLFIISIYTYHSFRVIAPLTVFLICLYL